MAAGQTRPVCGYTNPVNIRDGTLCLWESPPPRPVGTLAIFTVNDFRAVAMDEADPGESLDLGGPSVSALPRSIEVTEQLIREAMRDAPLESQQKGGISLPRVQQFVDRLLGGEEPPAIKVDDNMIVDGNHRYIAARILGIKPVLQPWAGGRPANAVRWEDLPIDLKFW